MNTGYREAARRCEMCQVETPPETLERLAELDCCARCRGGNLDAATAHWGFELESRHVPAGRRRQASFLIEVRRSTFVESFAKFERELGGDSRGWLSRLFRRRDPEVGDPAFDDAVRISPDEQSGGEVMLLLDKPGVRAAVKQIIELGCDVELTGQSVYIHDRDDGAFGSIGWMDEAIPYAMALAIHVERYACGDHA